ncbi:hypothetical protein L3Y34_006864 [Caenorhabditis briggsae]|uniref:Uncharacterized protein n=1 Tax=Caenorhabditis briggsae TaxID=6238 RepID=A0AAE9A5A6_CAEBR|nr:hypothetical protein L3Y34_006864 [Caenorhabditis briggsae]
MLLLGLLAIVAPLALGAPECFHEVNRLKEAYAYKFNIANMNENQYMEDLESIIEYELEKTDCSDPNYIDQTAVFLNARDKKTLFEDMLIGGNYRAMACKVTYCPRTGNEIVSYAVQTTIIQVRVKLTTVKSMDQPASNCHETWPVPKGGLCARVEQDTSMMTQRERQQWRENAIIDFLKKMEQERKMKQERGKSKYGRKSMVPFKCPPGETPEVIPGCYQSDEDPIGILRKWLRSRDGDKVVKNLNRKQKEEKRSESKSD